MLIVRAFQLMWRNLFKFYIIKWLYFACLMRFEQGSLICFVAPTFTAIVVGRTIARIGGSSVSNSAFLLIAY